MIIVSIKNDRVESNQKYLSDNGFVFHRENHGYSQFKGFEGRVISTNSTYNSSMDFTSFYACVWNDEENCAKTVFIGSDNCSDIYPEIKEIDAGDEILEKYEEYSRNEIVKFLKKSFENGDYSRTFTNITEGNEVFVFKGRKVPVGTTGRVARITFNSYDTQNPCVCIEDKKGNRHWTYMKNIRSTFTPYFNEEIIRDMVNNTTNPSVNTIMNKYCDYCLTSVETGV